MSLDFTPPMALLAHKGLRVWLNRSGQDEATQASFDLFSFKAVLAYGEMSIMGVFTHEEAMAICHILGPEIADQLLPKQLDELPRLLARFILAQEKVAKVGQIFRIDPVMLSVKVSRLHPVEALAVLDLVAQYFAKRRSSWDEETAIRLFHCLEDLSSRGKSGVQYQLTD